MNYILDTNLFFNLQAETSLGTNPKLIFESLTDYARKLRVAGQAQFYMPPAIVDELMTFVKGDEDYIRSYLAEITVKAPEKAGMSFGAGVFYDIVEDIRHRSYRGLQVAEEELARAVQEMLPRGAEMSKIDYQKAIGTHISKLRDRYRTATRVKFLDSVADLDIIALAKELDGTVVSADEGVIQWARKFGVREVFPEVWKKQLDSLLQA